MSTHTDSIHSPNLAHHFDDPNQQYESATLGMWAFLATEVLFFGGMFAAYSVYRRTYPLGFAEGSHHLDVVLGTINTGVLLLSSLTMALAVHAAQTGERKATSWLLVATIVLGSMFLGIKVVEYKHKIDHHLVPGRAFVLEHPHFEDVDPRHAQLFYSLYFTMTGFHALHMIIGVAVVGVLTWQSWQGRFSPEYYTPVEMTGLYWHFVDIVWVFLFPLLYLIDLQQ